MQDQISLFVSQSGHKNAGCDIPLSYLHSNYQLERISLDKHRNSQVALAGLFVVKSKDYRGVNWTKLLNLLDFDSQSSKFRNDRNDRSVSFSQLNNNLVRKRTKISVLPNQFKNPSLRKCRCWIAFFSN